MNFKNGKSMKNKINFRITQASSRLCKLIFLFCFLTNYSLAQEIPSSTTTDENGTISFPVQVSAFYPYGTHGQQSTNYAYCFSLNFLYGKIGKLNGIEISGLVGRVEGNVNGMQIAGIVNTSNDMKGLQIGGFGNAADDVKGIQIGGFGNTADNVRGIQIGGFGNAADNVKGIQIGGFGNAADNVRGIQIGGFGNAADKIDGLQIGGIYNRSNILRGLQIGIVSINDTIEKGISLSLVNIVKRGFYREWELSFSDYANIAVSYKMGMQKFYTIYTVGANFIEDNLWTVGIGFGNRTPIGNKFDFRPELVSYNYLPMDFKNAQHPFSTHLKFGFVYNINEKFGLSLAPSIYVMNASRKSDMEYYKTSPIGAFYKNEKNNKQTTIGAGISLGLSLR